MKTRFKLYVAAVLLAPATAVAQSSGVPTTCGSQTTASPVRSLAFTNSTTPFLWAIVNSVCTDLTGYIQSIDKGKTWSVDTPTLNLGAASVQVTAFFSADPFISFGATTTNIVPGPNTFTFLFGTPVSPFLYDAASSTGGVSVTDGARGNTTVNTSGVHPTYISGYGSNGPVLTNLGVDLGTNPCVASGTPFTVTTTCNQGSTSDTFAPAFYDNLEALLTYQQDDIASVASWSGAIHLTESVAPEPATIGLFGTGLLVLGGFVARRRTS